jgi:hypothetical protein
MYYFLSEEEIKAQDAIHAEANETDAEQKFIETVTKLQGKN